MDDSNNNKRASKAVERHLDAYAKSQRVDTGESEWRSSNPFYKGYVTYDNVQPIITSCVAVGSHVGGGGRSGVTVTARDLEIRGILRLPAIVDSMFTGNPASVMVRFMVVLDRHSNGTWSSLHKVLSVPAGATFKYGLFAYQNLEQAHRFQILSNTYHRVQRRNYSMNNTGFGDKVWTQCDEQIIDLKIPVDGLKIQYKDTTTGTFEDVISNNILIYACCSEDGANPPQLELISRFRFSDQ